MLYITVYFVEVLTLFVARGTPRKTETKKTNFKRKRRKIKNI
jgi:hypothetical protein